MNTGERPVSSNFGLLTTIAYKFGGGAAHYALKGASPLPARWSSGCATTLESLKKSLDVETLARTVDDNGGVYFVSRIFRAVRSVLEGECARCHCRLTRYANKRTSRVQFWKRRRFKRGKLSKPWKKIPISTLQVSVWMEAW